MRSNSRTILQSQGPSLQDGLEAARTSGFNIDGVSIRIKAKPWFSYSGKPVSLICLEIGRSDSVIVWLPRASVIRARNTFGIEEDYPAELFNKASLDDHGNVQLEDDTHLHACTVLPVPIPKWGSKEASVVSLAINFMGAQAQCLGMLGRRDPDDPNSLEMLQATPGATNLFIDYNAAAGLRMENEKFDAFLLYCEPHAEVRLARQTIARILSDAGIRVPQRKQAARAAAITSKSS